MDHTGRAALLGAKRQTNSGGRSGIDSFAGFVPRPQGISKRFDYTVRRHPDADDASFQPKKEASTPLTAPTSRPSASRARPGAGPGGWPENPHSGAMHPQHCHAKRVEQGRTTSKTDKSRISR